MPDDQNLTDKTIDGAKIAAKRAGQNMASRLNTPGKLVGELFAVQTTKNNLLAPFRMMGKLISRDIEAVRSMVQRREYAQYDFTGADTDHDRYEAALEQSGNAPIEGKIHTSINRRVNFFAMAATIFFSFGLIAAANGGPVHELVIGNLHGAVRYLVQSLPFLVGITMLTYFARWSFLSFQMRHRALLGLSTYIRHPSEWFNTGTGAAPFTQLMILVLIAVPALQHLNFGVAQAFAQAVPSLGGGGGAAGSASSSTVMGALTSSLGQGDLSFQWMTDLFPSYFQSVTGVSYQSDAVAQLLDVMNVTIMGLGSVMLSYHVVSGLVATAREGTFLGQKWHTVYAPIRVAMGAVGTVPIKGLSVASIVLIQVILAGCGLGNLTWDTYVNLSTGQSSGMMAITIPPSTLNQSSTFNQILNSAVCYKLAEYFERPASTTASPPLTPTALDQKLAPPRDFSGGSRPMFSYPSGGGTTGNFDFGLVCGGVKLPSFATAVPPPTKMVTMSAHTGVYKPISMAISKSREAEINLASSMNQAQQQFDSARNQAFSQFITKLLASPFVTSIAGGNAPGGTAITGATMVSGLSALRTDYSTYESAVLVAAGKMETTINSSAITAIRAKAETLGWASAGAMEPQLIAMGAKVDTAFSAKPEILPSKPGELASRQFLGRYNHLYSQIQNAAAYIQEGAMASLTANIAANPGGPTNLAVNTKSQIAEAIKSNPKNILGELGKYDHTFIEGYIVNQGTINTTNPLAEISDIGAGVKTAGYSTLGIYETIVFVASGTKGAAKGVWGMVAGAFSGDATNFGASGFAAVVRSLSMMIDLLSLWLIITGVTMEYIIPLLGYTIWVSAILMYVLFLIEAVVGAGFWAFSHIRADGDELVNQHQSYGWRVMPVMIFYPSLMVLGLILANVAMAAMIGFVNATFTQALGGNGSIWDPFGLVGVLTLLSGIYYNIITRSYRLITMIPEWIMRWMGAEGVNRGDGGGEQVHQGAVRDTQGAARSGVGSFRNNMRGGKGGGGPGGKGAGATDSAAAADAGAKAGSISGAAAGQAAGQAARNNSAK